MHQIVHCPSETVVLTLLRKHNRRTTYIADVLHEECLLIKNIVGKIQDQCACLLVTLTWNFQSVLFPQIYFQKAFLAVFSESISCNPFIVFLPNFDGTLSGEATMPLAVSFLPPFSMGVNSYLYF